MADLHRRAQVSQASNARYLASTAAVERTTTVGQSLAPLCRPVTTRAGVRSRALRPFDADDMKLLDAVGRGEFAINGLRNRDVRDLLWGTDEGTDAALTRRRSGQVTRQLRLLRAHGVIKRVPRTHRYLLTDKGRTLVTLLKAAQDADTKRLTAIAA